MCKMPNASNRKNRFITLIYEKRGHSIFQRSTSLGIFSPLCFTLNLPFPSITLSGCPRTYRATTLWWVHFWMFAPLSSQNDPLSWNRSKYFNIAPILGRIFQLASVLMHRVLKVPPHRRFISICCKMKDAAEIGILKQVIVHDKKRD